MLTPAIDALLEALAAEPANRLHRLVLADALEEAGDKRAAIVRTIQPKVQAVMERLWPKSKMVCEGLSWCPGEWLETIQSRRGKRIMYVRDLCEMIEDHTLLSDPDVVRASEIERGLAVLRLFGRKPRRAKKPAG